MWNDTYLWIEQILPFRKQFVIVDNAPSNEVMKRKLQLNTDCLYLTSSQNKEIEEDM